MFVQRLGFDGIEFPLRPGYQVEPQNAEKGLKTLCDQLAAYGITITSVASETTEQVFAGCAEAGVKVLRIMGPLDISDGYMKAEAAFRGKLESLVPLCERYGVTVGVQHHYGAGIFNAMELRHLLEGFNPKHIAGIWDAAHSALAGEIPQQSLDIVWDMLCLVNFKNAFYRRVNGPEAAQAQFEPYFTTGQNGNTNWKSALEYMKHRGYDGVLCMPAEYTDEANVESYIIEDLDYLKMLVEEVYGA